jgi:hypothetical protein
MTPTLVDADITNLKTLAICHWVWGGMIALFSCFAIIYIIMGVVFLNTTFPTNPGQTPPPPWFGWIFVGIGSVALLVGWTVGGLNIWSGFLMRRRRGWTLSIVTAALNCLSIPIGTTLAIFTFIVLTRSSVKAMYAAHHTPHGGR